MTIYGENEPKMVRCLLLGVACDMPVMLFLSVDWSKTERIRQKRSSHVIGASP